MSAHARFGPSAMKRIIACPGSVVLCEQAPPPPPSPYAEEGTKAHELAELLLLRTPEYSLPLADAEMRMAVDVYVQYCNPLIDQAEKYGIEVQVRYDEDLWGTVDCYALVDRTLYVIDYKHGAGVTVSAIRNHQLLTYAGLIFADKKTGVTPDMVDNVVVVVVQPRGQGKPIDEYITSVAEVEGHMVQVREAIRQAIGYKPRVAIGDHCRFCRAKIICPALQQAQAGVAEWDSRDLSEHELANMLTTARVLEQKIKDLFAYAHDRLEKGTTVPGWKLVPKRATRRWVDEERVLKFARKWGITKKISKRALISPTQASKLLGDRFESMNHLVIAESSGTNLVPEDDPRKAVQSPFVKLAALGKRAI